MIDKSNARARISLLLVLAVTAGSWIGFGLGRGDRVSTIRHTDLSDSSAVVRKSSAEDSKGANRGGRSDAAVATAALNTKPLPSLDTTMPLATQMPSLMERLQQGDPIAACRIAVDKIRCASARLSNSFGRDLTRQAARGNAILGEDRTVDFLAAREERLQATTHYCSDADDESLPEIADFPKAALARMSTRQKVILALVRQDGSIARFPRGHSSRMHLSGSSRYMISQYLADNMLQFLQQGLADADPLALEGMLIVHYPFFDLSVARIPSVSLPNPEAFARHAYLAEAVLGSEGLGPIGRQALLAIETHLPPDRVFQLRAEARNLSMAWRSRAQAQRGGSLDTDLDMSNLCLN